MRAHRHLLHGLLLGIGALLWAQPVLADGPIPCTCRAGGASHGLGEVVCMKTADGMRLARCDRVLNNTSWTPLETPCPVASLPAAETTTVAGLNAPD